MYVVISILIFIASILLILIVLVQNSKGGGLSAGFSSSNQVMGVRKTTDFLEKATWTLAGFVVLLSVVSAAFLSSATDVAAKQSIIKDEVQNAVQVDPNLNASPDFQQKTGNTDAAAKTQQAPATGNPSPTQAAPKN
jgi:preprotein translocase subunit SecG